MSIVQIPLRLASGAFILNSGLNKRGISAEQAQGLRDMGARGLPALANLSPEQFKKFLVTTEVGVGAALLAPFVPGWLAGSALTAFSGGLFSMYLNTPEMTEADGVRPSQEGTAVAKDIFLVGSGLAIAADSVANRPGKRRKAAKKRAARIEGARDAKVQAIRDAQDEKVAAIHAALEDADPERALRVTHRLKGAALVSGAMQLAEDVERVEALLLARPVARGDIGALLQEIADRL